MDAERVHYFQNELREDGVAVHPVCVMRGDLIASGLTRPVPHDPMELRQSQIYLGPGDGGVLLKRMLDDQSASNLVVFACWDRLESFAKFTIDADTDLYNLGECVWQPARDDVDLFANDCPVYSLCHDGGMYMTQTS